MGSRSGYVCRRCRVSIDFGIRGKNGNILCERCAEKERSMGLRKLRKGSKRV